MNPVIESPNSGILPDQPLPHPSIVQSYTPVLERIFDTVQVIQAFDDDDTDDADDDEPVIDDDDDIPDDDDFPPTQPG